MNWQPIGLVPTLFAAVLVVLNPKAAAGRDALFTVGEQTLHVETLGNAGPAVVFEAGLGNDTTTWKAVAGPVSAFARVVAYDRGGIGQSVPLMKKSTVTADNVAAKLRELLTAAGVRPPYILVGHSLGGLYVQMFARKYPGDVAGVVLLDASSPDAPDELKTLARLEPGTAAYFEEEGVAESNRQIKSAGRFPDIPLTVIAATDHGPFFKQWEPTLMQLQRQLATLSPQATLVVAEGSGHDVQHDRPETVIEAIRRMVAIAKTKP